MRIITGKARGVKLSALEGEDITRPTGDRVKEGLFSAIQFELEGKRVLDLFSGSGQLALEALSRGAESAVLIDESDKAVEIIKENAKKTGLMKQCRIARQDYSEYLKSASGREKFGLVFLDPPYAKDIPNEVLKKLCRADIVAPGGLVVCESDRDDMMGDLYDLTYRKTYKYGRVYITIFEKNVENFGKEEEHE